MPQAQQLGRYHLLDRIAYGGMAEIFRAKTFDHVGQVHYVAVKRLLSHLVTDDEFLQMLVDEAKISALLQHQNIARVYEFARQGEEYFLAMEYVDGKDVRALLERGRQEQLPMPPEHAAWIAMECATALHAAHTQRDRQGAALRIVHRDVSPSNILCSYRGDIKLCDFGIAKATLTRVQTKTGVIKGKVKYMSPEQAMGRKLDHRSDIFSLGTVLYEMLTLQAPFAAPTEVELIFAVRDARKKPVRELAPDVPPQLASIVDKAMTRSRTTRYQSGEELALDLRLFLDEYRPGYRRSNFSRYMRKQFGEEIERELRVLEQYVVDQVDGTNVGANLIADALDADAPVSKFTPMPPPSLATGTGSFPGGGSSIRKNPISPAELHALPTQAPSARTFHERGTMLLDPRRPAMLPTGARPSAPRPKFLSEFHELPTQLKHVNDIRPTPRPDKAAAPLRLPGTPVGTTPRPAPPVAAPPPSAPPKRSPPPQAGPQAAGDQAGADRTEGEQLVDINDLLESNPGMQPALDASALEEGDEFPASSTMPAAENPFDDSDADATERERPAAERLPAVAPAQPAAVERAAEDETRPGPANDGGPAFAPLVTPTGPLPLHVAPPPPLPPGLTSSPTDGTVGPRPSPFAAAPAPARPTPRPIAPPTAGAHPPPVAAPRPTPPAGPYAPPSHPAAPPAPTPRPAPTPPPTAAAPASRPAPTPPPIAAAPASRPAPTQPPMAAASEPRPVPPPPAPPAALVPRPTQKTVEVDAPDFSEILRDLGADKENR